MFSSNKYSLILVILITTLIILIGCNNQTDLNFIDYNEKFINSSSGWDVLSKPNLNYDYINGKYTITTKQNYHNFWSLCPIDNLSRDYLIESNIRITNGSGYYGLIFNFINKNNYYLFYIDTFTQSFCLRKVHNGSQYTIINWSKTKYIFKKQYNNLKIMQSKNIIELYINNFKLAEKKISTHPDGINVGIFVSTLDNRNEFPLSVEIDNFNLLGYSVQRSLP